MPVRPRVGPPPSPGFEPALGRPDPSYQPPLVVPAAVTHYPSRNGPVCDTRPIPTQANAYTVDTPTCPKCLDWITKTRAATEATYGKPTAPPPEPEPVEPPEPPEPPPAPTTASKRK